MYCKRKFRPFARHPDQRACGSAECQRRRRADYHQKKLARDSLYREQCRDSQKKWRDKNPGYLKHYRARQPSGGSRDDERSHLLNEVDRLRDLLKNGSALELRSFGANILLVCPADLIREHSRRDHQWQLQMIWWRTLAHESCPQETNKRQECSGPRTVGSKIMGF